MGSAEILGSEWEECGVYFVRRSKKRGRPDDGKPAYGLFALASHLATQPAFLHIS